VPTRVLQPRARRVAYRVVGVGSGEGLLSMLALLSGSGGFHVLAERPDESRELAGDGDNDLVAL
jgi:hypothetical protein